MAHSFIAYIDESGDDGLAKFRVPGTRGGSSNWLNISCLLTRNTHSLDIVKWRDNVAEVRPISKTRSIHFVDFNHSQKIAASQALINFPIRVCNILSNKTTIPNNTYSHPNQLYFYLTRYLIERLSWLCRDMRPMVPEGDGLVKIIFSRRGGLSYQDFKNYLQVLRNTLDDTVRIHWPVIDVDGIEAKDHSASAGLQLADIAASAITAGVESDYFGNCEKRYAEIIKPVIYNRSNNYLSYGLKIVPRPEEMLLSDQQLTFIDLFK